MVALPGGKCYSPGREWQGYLTFGLIHLRDGLCFGSRSESGSALDPHSMGSWIRIHTANAHPDPEERKSAKKRRNIESEDQQKFIKNSCFMQ
jgi:hypothetical protein